MIKKGLIVYKSQGYDQMKLKASIKYGSGFSKLHYGDCDEITERYLMKHIGRKFIQDISCSVMLNRSYHKLFLRALMRVKNVKRISIFCVSFMNQDLLEKGAKYLTKNFAQKQKRVTFFSIKFPNQEKIDFYLYKTLLLFKSLGHLKVQMFNLSAVDAFNKLLQTSTKRKKWTHVKLELYLKPLAFSLQPISQEKLLATSQSLKNLDYLTSFIPTRIHWDFRLNRNPLKQFGNLIGSLSKLTNFIVTGDIQTRFTAILEALQNCKYLEEVQFNCSKFIHGETPQLTQISQNSFSYLKNLQKFSVDLTLTHSQIAINYSLDFAFLMQITDLNLTLTGKISDDILLDLLAFVSSLPRLQALQLGFLNIINSLGISNHGLQRFCGNLKCLNRLKSFRLQFNDLAQLVCDQVIGNLCVSLQNFTDLSDLNLYVPSFEIGEASILHLQKTFTSLKKLEKLSVYFDNCNWVNSPILINFIKSLRGLQYLQSINLKLKCLNRETGTSLGPTLVQAILSLNRSIKSNYHFIVYFLNDLEPEIQSLIKWLKSKIDITFILKAYESKNSK